MVMAMAMAGSLTNTEVVFPRLSKEIGPVLRSRTPGSLLVRTPFQVCPPTTGRRRGVGSCVCSSSKNNNSTGSSSSQASGVIRCDAEESQVVMVTGPMMLPKATSRRVAMVSLLALITASTPLAASAAAEERRPSEADSPSDTVVQGRNVDQPEVDTVASYVTDIFKTRLPFLRQDCLNSAIVLAMLPMLMKLWNHPSVPELVYAGAGEEAALGRDEESSEEEFEGPTFLMSNGSDLKDQIREMKAAEQRWKQQVRDGRIKSLSPKEAGYAVQLAGSVLLDVRPSFERNKSWVKNSVWVPVFEVDKGMDPGTLMKKLSAFIMGGWWEGTSLMKRNERFMADVVARIPKDANVIVSCQKGLRSLAACEQLLKAGYKNVSWLNGGYDTAEDGDFEKEGPQPLKFAGIGGMSEFLGWTDVQRIQASKEGITYRLMLFGRLVLVVAAVDALFVGAQKLNQILRH